MKFPNCPCCNNKKVNKYLSIIDHLIKSCPRAKFFCPNKCKNKNKSRKANENGFLYHFDNECNICQENIIGKLTAINKHKCNYNLNSNLKKK